MFHENDAVKLKHNIPAHSPTAWQGTPSVDLAAGDIGTVISVYTNDSVHYEYEVEFVDEDGPYPYILPLQYSKIGEVFSDLVYYAYTADHRLFYYVYTIE